MNEFESFYQFLNKIDQNDPFFRSLDYLKYTHVIEEKLTQFKKVNNLPNLDSTISSKSILESFERRFRIKDSYRPVDYQFYLLIFLFLQNHKYYQIWPDLHFIVDSFLDQILESLRYIDIEKTSTGATCCKTNIRFALKKLRDLGLVEHRNKSNKRSWGPTYFGFFVAANICINNPFKNSEQYSHFDAFNFSLKQIGPLDHFNNDAKLTASIYDLNEQRFASIIDLISKESLNLEYLGMAPKIFIKYANFIDFQVELFNDKKLSIVNYYKSMKDFLTSLNRDYELDRFMAELSLKFDAERFFQNQIKKILE